MASSSSSSSSSSSTTRRWIYDVFLSFRGEDVRKSFVDHLYFALDQKGVFTFKDDERLDKGKSIAPDLLKSIEESRFAVIVFSKTYASSSWCLDELAKIMEWSKSMGQTVMPVFYDVDPSHVRKQTGDFGEAFAKHNDSPKVETWRIALAEAASISGWDLQHTADGHESKCIQQIVGEILSKLGDTFSSDVENLVGIESRIEKVNALLGIGSDDIRIVGIWGLSGIGKTTIARAIFDKFSNQFEGGSFLHEVRDASKKHGLERLQETLLSETLMLKNLRINNVYEGINMIRRRLHYKRVLVVLDDVDNLHQLDALAGKHEWFGFGSRIIITTKDKHLLVGHDVDRIHKMSVLNDDEAIQLFSWKAFKKIHPKKDYEEISNQIVHCAGGLPLALRVLGSALYGRDMAKWRSVLEKLIKEGPEGEILEKLKISFDGLNDAEKKIFLDIACFFIGKKKDTVTRILDSFGFYPHIGLSVLIEKSLISLSKNRIWMHQLIQEMGWRIVRHSSPEEPGNHSRLWITEDIINVLTRSTGTKKIEGIYLNLLKPIDIDVRTEAFTMMNKLRLLKIHNTCVSRGPEYFPNELRWLNWHGFPSKSMPSSFQAEKLVGLKMCYSRIVQLWKGNKMLDRLKYINLSHSQKLIRTPDFTELPNLERLILEGCTSLVAIHPSIGVLKRLVFINLKDCENLRSLPNTIQLESLEIFILSGCLKLPKFPEISEKMEHLLEVYLEGTAIRELPSSIEHLTNLVLINLSYCKNLTSLPDTICLLKHLKVLILSGCSNLDKLPDDLGNLECLEELHGDKTAITRPPPSIVLLKNLKYLSFRGCKGTMSQSWTPPFLSWLVPRKHQGSMSLVFPSVSGLCSLTKLDLSDCNLLDGAIPSDLGCLSSLDELNLGRNNFASIPAATLNQLSRLKILGLVGCNMLEALPELPSSIVELYADDCPSLKIFADILTKNDKLINVSFSNCLQLLEGRQSNNMYSIIWQHMLQGLSVVDDEVSIFLPGREIPEWFSNQNMGPSISMNLPLQWYNNKFMGFALCAVFELITTGKKAVKYACLQSMPGLDVQVRVITNSNYKHPSYSATLCNIGTDKIVDSEHVCLAYLPFKKWFRSDLKEDSPNNWCKIEVSIFHLFKRCTVMKKWGIRLVYDDDVRPKDELMAIQHSSHPENTG